MRLCYRDTRCPLCKTDAKQVGVWGREGCVEGLGGDGRGGTLVKHATQLALLGSLQGSAPLPLWLVLQPIVPPATDLVLHTGVAAVAILAAQRVVVTTSQLPSERLGSQVQPQKAA
jgi:hypothetical protein